MFGDEPGRFFSRHPVQMIEPREVHRTRMAPEGAFAAQVEVNVKIAHGQLAQAAIHRLAITAAGEIRFRHRTPVSAHSENRHYMIGVLFRFQIKNQWWKTDDTKRSRRENSAFET